MEPSEEDIKERAESRGLSYYDAREELRDEEYSSEHDKLPGESWGDYWKRY